MYCKTLTKRKYELLCNKQQLVNLKKHKLKIVMNKYKTSTTPLIYKHNFKKHLKVLSKEPTILKCKNFEKRYNFLINV